MSLRKALLAATVLSLPMAAQAQQVTGLYVGAGAGANWLQTTDDNVATGAFGPLFGLRSNEIKAKFETGFGGVISVGYGFGNGLRAEVEGNYRQNDVDAARAFGVPVRGDSGTARSFGVMGNVLYDFVLPSFIPQFTPVVPYIGGGVGYVWHDYNDVGTRLAGGPGAGFRGEIDDRDGNFAYQGIAGLAFPLNRVAPGLALTAEYRFLGTLSPDLRARAYTPAGARVGGVDGKVDVDNFNHSVFVGLRYALNAPAPAPAPVAPTPAVAPAAPARTYLVFFDWDRADLTDRARQIIGEAAQNARRVSSTRIEVAGHADRSGTPQYNQRLSQRRAEAVAAELARQGISRNEMSIQAFGESRPLVPTADGVREPQNRRVEIVLR